jgi:hypothetical protein
MNRRPREGGDPVIKPERDESIRGRLVQGLLN